MKTYEIEGLKIISNIYHERLWARINKKLEKLTPFIFVGLMCWVAFLYLHIIQFPTLVTINYLQ